MLSVHKLAQAKRVMYLRVLGMMKVERNLSLKSIGMSTSKGHLIKDSDE